MSKFKPEDFGTDGLSPEDFKRYHAHLSAAYANDYVLLIGSKRPGVLPYAVQHDGESPLECECDYYRHRADCKSHWPRAQLVLDRAKARREREAAQLVEVLLYRPRSFSKLR